MADESVLTRIEALVDEQARDADTVEHFQQ
jgi:hypothetical protein